MIIGTPALASEAAYERLYHAMLVRGHNASYQLDAIGAIDSALWDIRGQKWNAPVCELLGGPVRELLPAYLSGLRRPSPEERLEAARRAVGDGLTGVKLFIGQPSADSLNELRGVRAAIGPAGDAGCRLHSWGGLGRRPSGWPGTRRVKRLLFGGSAWHGGPRGASRAGKAHPDTAGGGREFRSVPQYLPWLRAGHCASLSPMWSAVGSPPHGGSQLSRMRFTFRRPCTSASAPVSGWRRRGRWPHRCRTFWCRSTSSICSRPRTASSPHR